MKVISTYTPATTLSFGSTSTINPVSGPLVKTETKPAFASHDSVKFGMAQRYYVVYGSSGSRKADENDWARRICSMSFEQQRDFPVHSSSRHNALVTIVAADNERSVNNTFRRNRFILTESEWNEAKRKAKEAAIKTGKAGVQTVKVAGRTIKWVFD